MLKRLYLLVLKVYSHNKDDKTMNILCALLMIICIILVLIELKIFNKIEVRMKK